jgi:hypothetical protein
MKQAQAGKPEDLLQQSMVQQSVRAAKILYLQQQAEKVGATQQACQDAKQVQG